VTSVVVRISLDFNRKLIFCILFCVSSRSEIFPIHFVDFVSVLCPSPLSHEGTQDLSGCADVLV
jgi:hypothetical protein